MTSGEELFQRASKGELSQKELQSVVERVEASKHQEDPELYLLLAILGEGGFQEYRPLVEHFLHCPSDPSIAEIALTTLTENWNLADEYLDVIKTFISGVDWDTREEVRISAIAAAGRWLQRSEDDELLDEIIEIIGRQEEAEIVRDAASAALSNAVERYEALMSKSSRDDTLAKFARWQRRHGHSQPGGDDVIKD